MFCLITIVSLLRNCCCFVLKESGRGSTWLLFGFCGKHHFYKDMGFRQTFVVSADSFLLHIKVQHVKNKLGLDLPSRSVCKVIEPYQFKQHSSLVLFTWHLCFPQFCKLYWGQSKWSAFVSTRHHYRWPNQTGRELEMYTPALEIMEIWLLSK